MRGKIGARLPCRARYGTFFSLVFRGITKAFADYFATLVPISPATFRNPLHSARTMTTSYALRQNGSCSNDLVDCGATAASFHACCPQGTICPHSTRDISCCPAGEDYTQPVATLPQCADPSWKLFDDYGYFCCAPDRQGFVKPKDYKGCADPGYSLLKDEQWVKMVLTQTCENWQLE